MTVRIRLTADCGELKVGDELEAQEIDVDGDAVVTFAQKFPISGADDDGTEYIWKGYYELVDQSARVQELEAEVARLRTLVPEGALLPQEIGIWKSGSMHYIRLGENDWIFVSDFELTRRTDVEMNRGTRDGQGVPRLGEKIS